MNLVKNILSHKLIIALPVISMAIIYMWQPISEVFRGTYNDNVIVVLETEILKIDKNKQLIVIHVKPQNNGNMPIDITSEKKHGKFTVEVRKLQNLDVAMWQDYEKLPLVNSIDLLRRYKDGYTIETGAFYDEVESIALTNGFYWINAKLTFDNGDYVNESSVIKLTNDKAN